MSNRHERGPGRWVFARSIRRNGKRVYHPTGGVFRFWVRDK